MGDSEDEPVDFQGASPDIGAAIDVLQQRVPTVRRVVLWGLCDGASAALLYLHQSDDKRVAGLCLANPWVRSEASHALTQVKHYYGQRLLQGEFWRKLMRGGVAVGAIRELLKNIAVGVSGSGVVAADLPYQDRMAAAWRTFGGPMLLLLSSNDFTAKEFLEYAAMNRQWTGALARASLTRHELVGADHTFSHATHAAQVEVQLLAWLNGISGAATSARSRLATTE
jgi:exosortase A-associated hydrolase 1